MVNGMGLWNWAYHISLRCNIKYPHRNPGSVLDLSICCPILRGSMGNSSAGEGQSMSANSPSKFLELSHVIYSWRSGLWLVGGLEHGRSPSFFRGVGIPPTSIIYNYIYIRKLNIPIHQHPNPPTSQPVQDVCSNWVVAGSARVHLGEPPGCLGLSHWRPAAWNGPGCG